MKPWKAVLGVGAACAACCAIPLLGGTAALAAAGTAWLACADELALLAAVLLALAAATGGVLWRKRRAARRLFDAFPPQPDAHKACGCPPGACG